MVGQNISNFILIIYKKDRFSILRVKIAQDHPHYSFSFTMNNMHPSTFHHYIFLIVLNTGLVHHARVSACFRVYQLSCPTGQSRSTSSFPDSHPENRTCRPLKRCVRNGFPSPANPLDHEKRASPPRDISKALGCDRGC